MWKCIAHIDLYSITSSPSVSRKKTVFDENFDQNRDVESS